MNAKKKIPFTSRVVVLLILAIPRTLGTTTQHSFLGIAEANGVSQRRRHVQTGGNACFEDSDELQRMVQSFIADGCSDTNNCNNEAVQKYGWPIGSWCFGDQVTDMSALFFNAKLFDDDISEWDVSSITTMSNMFQGCSIFDGDLSKWDVSSVTNMDAMFLMARTFRGESLSSWDVSSVKSMQSMFSFASVFTGDISTWDVFSVQDMSHMFQSAAEFQGDLSSWDVSSVKAMESAFGMAKAFDSDLSQWDVSSVLNMNGMFMLCHNFRGDLSQWDVASVVDMTSMFQGANQFNSDISRWDVSSVKTIKNFLWDEGSSIEYYPNHVAFRQNLCPWKERWGDHPPKQGATVLMDKFCDDFDAPSDTINEDRQSLPGDVTATNAPSSEATEEIADEAATWTIAPNDVDEDGQDIIAMERGHEEISSKWCFSLPYQLCWAVFLYLLGYVMGYRRGRFMSVLSATSDSRVDDIELKETFTGGRVYSDSITEESVSRRSGLM